MKTVYIVAAMICEGDKVLITQRATGDYKGKWEFPGGKIELGENPETALIREIKEELSVTVNVEKEVRIIDYKYPDFQLIMRTYWCSLASGELHLNEHSDAKWITYDELDDIDWLPADQYFINNYKINLHIIMNAGYRERYEKLTYAGDLEAYVTNTTRTVDLLDKFEGAVKSTDMPYKRLILKNNHGCLLDNHLCHYRLIIERINAPEYAVGNITFTEFKKTDGQEVFQYCSEQLTEALREDIHILEKSEFYFKRPFLLRAQNSSNRTGYGWEWDWSNGIGSATEGTFYGETSNYGIVGVVLEGKPKKRSHTRTVKTANAKVETVYYKGKKYFSVHEENDNNVLIPYRKDWSNDDVLKIYFASKKSQNK